MKKWIKNSGFQTLLLLITLVFIYQFSQKRNQNKPLITKMQFDEGTNLFITHDMVNKLLIQNEGDFKNQANSTVDLHQVEKLLSNHPLISEASVYKSINGLLNINIKQREPIVRVVTSAKDFYIDSEATIMPLSKNYTKRVILCSGEVNEGDVQSIYALAKKITKNPFLNNFVTGIVKKRNNNYILKTKNPKQEITLGNLNQMDVKINNLIVFLKKAIADESIRRYKNINLHYTLKQVVCAKFNYNGR